MSQRFLKWAGSALLAAAVFACSEGATKVTDTSSLANVAGGTPGAADVGEVELCKVGPQSIFRTVVDSANNPRFRLGPDACTVVTDVNALGRGNHTVTIIEDVLHGQVLDSIVVTSIASNNPVPQRGPPITGTNQTTVVFNGDRGFLVQFFNH
jgi:hypothetical protein